MGFRNSSAMLTVILFLVIFRPTFIKAHSKNTNTECLIKFYFFQMLPAGAKSSSIVESFHGQ